jgi:hypothetical protein
LTCQSGPIRFALSLQRFVSREEIGDLRNSSDAAVRNPGEKFQRVRGIYEIA